MELCISHGLSSVDSAQVSGVHSYEENTTLSATARLEAQFWSVTRQGFRRHINNILTPDSPAGRTTSYRRPPHHFAGFYYTDHPTSEKYQLKHKNKISLSVPVPAMFLLWPP
jgi:hypothetical protein